MHTIFKETLERLPERVANVWAEVNASADLYGMAPDTEEGARRVEEAKKDRAEMIAIRKAIVLADLTLLLDAGKIIFKETP
jgi:hypothetical protein